MTEQTLSQRIVEVAEAAADAAFQRDELVAVLASPFADATKVALMTWEVEGMTSAQWAARCPSGECDAATEWAFERQWEFADTDIEVRHVQ